MPRRSRPEMRDLFYEGNMKDLGSRGVTVGECIYTNSRRRPVPGRMGDDLRFANRSHRSSGVSLHPRRGLNGALHLQVMPCFAGPPDPGASETHHHNQAMLNPRSHRLRKRLQHLGLAGYAAPADTKVTLLGTRGGASLNKDLPTRPIW